MHHNFHSLCQGLWLMGAAWHCGSGQEGVSTPCCSYPAHKEKLEPRQGPVFTAEHWGTSGLSKIACDAPQIPHCGLATDWKDWSCFHSHPGVLLKSLATALVCGSVIPCLPKRAPDRSDEEFGGLCIVLCFVLISWSASGVLVVVLCRVVPQTTAGLGAAWRLPQAVPQGSSGLGTGQWNPRADVLPACERDGPDSGWKQNKWKILKGCFCSYLAATGSAGDSSFFILLFRN